MKLFTGPIKGSLTILLCGVFFMGEIQLLAAIAPLSHKQLDEQSELIVTGRVVAVESKVQKSRIERAVGIHRDRIYGIKLELISLHKKPPLPQVPLELLNESFYKPFQLLLHQVILSLSSSQDVGSWHKLIAASTVHIQMVPQVF